MIGWLDLAGGVSGDMLLGACLDAGVPIETVRDAVARLALPERVTITPQPVLRSGIAATHAVVECAESHHHRHLADVVALLERLDEPVRSRAVAVFTALAHAEATVHRVGVEEVHFHEVGALDSIADVVGVVVGLHELERRHGVTGWTAGAVALGGGRARTEHGSIPVPGPATLELLRAHGVPARGGPIDLELATPTGVALVAVLCGEQGDGFGPMPPVTPAVVGVGAGTRDPEGHANITRVVVGDPSAMGDASAWSTPPSSLPSVVQLDANVDDLDPRLWPGVLSRLLDAGALDAWLTPVLMKKGRPAHVVSVLAPPPLADPLTDVLVRHTTTIGVRRHRVERTVLARELVDVSVLGGTVRVKVSRLGSADDPNGPAGEVVSATPEFDDVARLAGELDLPERTVLAAAIVAAGGSRDAS